MRTKRKTYLLFFILSLIFAVVSMPYSGALSTGKLERTASAKIVSDDKGILKLDGFQNKLYNMNNKYANFGTITNNTMQIVKLTVVVCPEINWMNALSTFRVKIGNEEGEFSYLFSSPKKIVITLNPGQTVNAAASLVNNATSLRTSFQFTATNADGSYSAQLTDKINTPRNIVCF